MNTKKNDVDLIQDALSHLSLVDAKSFAEWWRKWGGLNAEQVNDLIDRNDLACVNDLSDRMAKAHGWDSVEHFERFNQLFPGLLSGSR